jgi:hypothetical protein
MLRFRSFDRLTDPQMIMGVFFVLDQDHSSRLSFALVRCKGSLGVTMLLVLVDPLRLRAALARWLGAYLPHVEHIERGTCQRCT